MVTQGFQQHLTHWPSSYSISLKVSGGGPQPTPCLTALRRGATQGRSQENSPGPGPFIAVRGSCPGNRRVHSTKKEKRVAVQSGRMFGQEQEGRELECGCPADSDQIPAATPIGLRGHKEPLHLSEPQCLHLHSGDSDTLSPQDYYED